MKDPLQIRQKLKSILIGATVTLFVAYPQASFASPEMKSIIEFLDAENINSNGTENPVHLQFTGLRCTAILTMLVQNLDDNGLKDMARRIEIIHDNALNSVIISTSSNQKFIETQLKIMISAYLERWQKAKALTGSWSNDPIIKSDIDTCTQIFGKKR